MGPRALVGVDVLGGVGGLGLIFPNTDPVVHATPARIVIARTDAADDFKAGGDPRNGRGTGPSKRRRRSVTRSGQPRIRPVHS